MSYGNTHSYLPADPVLRLRLSPGGLFSGYGKVVSAPERFLRAELGGRTPAATALQEQSSQHSVVPAFHGDPEAVNQGRVLLVVKDAGNLRDCCKPV